jgi:hypothetical protein
MRTGVHRWTVALAAGMALLAAVGCSTTREAAAPDAFPRDALGVHVYPRPCPSLWPEVLRLLASKQFQLVGTDRAAAGQPPRSGMANFFSLGFQTEDSNDGRLLVATDWNAASIRYQASGTAVPPSGCVVVFTRFADVDGDGSSKVESWTDWQMALELLRRIDAMSSTPGEPGVPRNAS